MKSMMFFGDRPNVGDRPDDVVSSDDLSPMKSMGWTILTMVTPKGGPFGPHRDLPSRPYGGKLEG